MTTPGYNTGGQNISGQFGMPLYGVAGLLPFGGNFFWVDSVNGSDGNTGGPSDPLATVGAAYALCTSGNNDVVFVNGTFTLAATLTWAKNKTHLIGLTGPAAAENALLTVASVAATTGAFSPLVNVTATGCIFQNISAKSGIAQAATQVTWAEAGGKNTYINVSLNQVGHATAAAQAGNRALTIASIGCTFLNCNIGGDAIVRATGTNSSVTILAGAGQTLFRGCVFPMWSSVAANTFIVAATTVLTGNIILDACILVNNVLGAGYTANTQAFSISATAGGVLIVTPSTVVVGATILNTGGTGPVYSSSAAAAAAGNKGTVAT